MKATKNIFDFFTGKNQNKASKPIIVNQEKLLSKQNEEIKKWINENSENIAQGQSWKDNEAFKLDLFAPIAFIRESYQALVNNVSSVYDKNLQVLQIQFDKYADKYEQNTIDEKKIPKQILELEDEQKSILDEASTCHDDDIQTKKERLGEIKDDIKNNRQDLKTKKRWDLRPYWIKFIIGIIIIATGELLINSDTFLYLGFNSMKSTLIGLAVSAVIFMIGFGQASVIRSETMKLWTKIGASIGFTISILSLFLVLGYIRATLISNQDGSEGLFQMSPYHFVGISIAFYIAIAICKAYFYPPVAKLSDNEVYKAKKADLKDNLKEEKQLQKIIANGYASRNNKRKAVKKDFGKDINPLVQNIKAENSIIRQSVVGYNAEIALARNFYKEVNSSYKLNVALLINTINIRKKSDAPSLQMTKLDDLDNPFENMELLINTPSKATSKPSTTEINNGTPSTAWDIMNEAQTGEISYSFTNTENNKS